MDVGRVSSTPCVVVVTEQTIETQQVKIDRQDQKSQILTAPEGCETSVIVQRESAVVDDDNGEPITLLQTKEQEHAYRRLMVIPDDVASGRHSAMSEARATSPSSLDARSFTLPSGDDTTEYKEFNQSTLHRFYGNVTPYGTVAQRSTDASHLEVVDGDLDGETSQRSMSPGRTYSRSDSYGAPMPKTSVSGSVYSTLLRTSRTGPEQILLCSKHVSYVDFVPSKVKKSCGRREYKSFSDCMDQANMWLNEHRHEIRLLRCESIRHRLDHTHRVNPESTTSHDRSYVIALRLWFYRADYSSSGDRTSQKLCYQNFLPQYKQTDKPTGWKSSDFPFFDNLQATLKKLNQYLEHSPISGNLISIESIPVNYKTVFRSKCNLEVDESYCCLEFQGQWDFFFIRMFYLEDSDLSYNKPMDVKDFVPYPVTFPPSVIEFQTFSTLVARANRWMEANGAAEIISVQTVEIPFKSKMLEVQKGHVKSNGMSYECPRYSVHWDTIRVLRVWFKEGASRQQVHTQQLRTDVKPLMEVRTFFPEQLTMPGCCGAQKPIFATTHDTVQRIDKWVTATGAEIVDIETDSFEKWSGRPRRVQNDLDERCYNKEDYASTMTRSALDYRLTAFRVYYRPNALTGIENTSAPSKPVKPFCCFVGCNIM